jgi:putative transport protein
MVDVLADNPILLLFLVAASGFLVGRIKVAGFSIGVAAVLFAGIAFGAIDERLRLPDEIWTLGLAVFVYTVGLAGGPGFVAALRRRGLASNAVVLGVLVAVATTVVLVSLAAGFGGPRAAGVFSGAMTNTPALAGALEYLQDHVSAARFSRVGADPVVGYSLTYPLGVLIPLLAVSILRRRARRQPAAQPLVAETVLVEREDGPSLGELRERFHHELTFTRLRHDGRTVLATPEVVPERGDLVVLVGAEPAVHEATATLGHRADEQLELDRESLDFRRILVSSRQTVERRVGELDLHRRFGATLTRVRRGDVDILADDETVLEPGDRVRVVAPRERMAEITRFFGDSYRVASELDVLTFGLGIAAGLALGLVELPLPGGSTFQLGVAGGPLLVGLTLGALGRTGPLVWQIPYGANMTLRQVGLVLFLAGIGIRSGQAFASTIVSWDGLYTVAVGALVTSVSVVLLVGLAALVLRMPAQTLSGTLAATQTQPAVLAAACEGEADERAVNIGYATVYPIAIITKIVLAQVVLAVLLR